jgi:hypothetical protein
LKTSPGADCEPVAAAEEIRHNNVFHRAEIARRGPVAMNDAFLAAEQRGDPLRDYGRVSAHRILPRTEDVEVTQANAFESVMLEELPGINFAHLLRRAVRRQRLAERLLRLRKGAGCHHRPALELA